MYLHGRESPWCLYPGALGSEIYPGFLDTGQNFAAQYIEFAERARSELHGSYVACRPLNEVSVSEGVPFCSTSEDPRRHGIQQPVLISTSRP
jgi:hypothetical protein